MRLQFSSVSIVRFLLYYLDASKGGLLIFLAKFKGQIFSRVDTTIFFYFSRIQGGFTH